MNTTLHIVLKPGDEPRELEVTELAAGTHVVTSGEIEPTWIIHCERSRFQVVPCATMCREGTYDGGHEQHELPWRLPVNPPPAERIEITPVVPPPDDDALIAAHREEADLLYQRMLGRWKRDEPPPSFEERIPFMAKILLHRHEAPAGCPAGWLTAREREIVIFGRTGDRAKPVLDKAKFRAAFRAHNGIVRQYLLARVEAFTVGASEASRLDAVNEQLAQTIGRAEATQERLAKTAEALARDLRVRKKASSKKAVSAAATYTPQEARSRLLRRYRGKEGPIGDKQLRNLCKDAGVAYGETISHHDFAKVSDLHANKRRAKATRGSRRLEKRRMASR